MFSRIARSRPIRSLAPILIILLVTACVAQPQIQQVEPEVRELAIAQGLDPETLDPHLSTVQATLNVSTAVCEPLLDKNWFTGEFEPVLLTEWTQLDELTWEFKVREGVTFHNGEELTADVIKWNLERIKDPETQAPAGRTYAGQFEIIEAPDENTLRITTSAPSPVMLLNMHKMYICSREAVEEMGPEEFARNPVGTGPYKFVEWVKDDRVVLEANPDYWGGTPNLDRVVFQPIPEPATRAAALRTGQADIVTLLPVSEAAAITEDPNLDVAAVPSLRLMYFILDAAGDSAVADPRVRQALNYAVDKQAIIDSVMEGYGEILDGQVLSPEYFGYNPDLEPYPYDPEMAQDLLAEAGYADGLEITLHCPQGRYMQDKEVCQAATGQLEEVGVTVNLQVKEWAAYIQELIAKTLVPVAYIGMSTYGDADPMLGIHLTGNPYSYYANSEYDELIRAAGATTDEEERLRLYEQATDMMYDDPPGIFMFQQMDIYGANKRVEGFQPRPDERIVIQQGAEGISVTTGQ